MIKKLIYLLFVPLSCISLKAQNLIPNPGFEIYSQCPNDEDQIDRAIGWFNMVPSTNYFNNCASNPLCNVPNNHFGHQDALSGNGYFGITSYVYPFYFPPPPPPSGYTVYYYWDVAEAFGIKLKYKLKAGMKYNCGFYCSLADSCVFATKNLGMLFDADSIAMQSGLSEDDRYRFIGYIIDSLDPQIRYSGNTFLDDRNGWMKIEGSFVANGTERFVYIGNFDHSPLVDTLFLGDSTYTQSSLQNLRFAYYYIDDVWVYEDSTVGLPENKAPAITIYPNPATHTINIDIPKNYPNPQLYIYNLTGQLVATKPIQANQPVPITELNAGMYIFAIQSNNTLVGRQRVVVY